MYNFPQEGIDNDVGRQQALCGFQIPTMQFRVRIQSEKYLSIYLSILNML